jgi:hypothetical protein
LCTGRERLMGESDRSHDPFDGIEGIPKPSENALSTGGGLEPSGQKPDTPDDIKVPNTTVELESIVGSVVTRVMRDSVLPVVQRALLKIDALDSKVKQMQLAMEDVCSKEGQIVEELEAVRELLSRTLKEEEVQATDGSGDDGHPVEDPSPSSSSEPDKGSSDDIRDLKESLHALMEENERKMRLLDARLALPQVPSGVPAPPPPPAPVPPAPYVPPPPPRPPPSATTAEYYNAPPKLQYTHSDVQNRGNPTCPPRSMQASSVPIERVIDDIAVMGFSREEVRNVIRELGDEMGMQGKPLDMNVVLDRLGTN